MSDFFDKDAVRPHLVMDSFTDSSDRLLRVNNVKRSSTRLALANNLFSWSFDLLLDLELLIGLKRLSIDGCVTKLSFGFYNRWFCDRYLLRLLSGDLEDSCWRDLIFQFFIKKINGTRICKINFYTKSNNGFCSYIKIWIAWYGQNQSSCFGVTDSHWSALD